MRRVLGSLTFVILLVLLGQHWPQARTKLLRPAEPVSFSEWCAQEDARYSRPLRAMPKAEVVRLISIVGDEDTQSDSYSDNNQKKIRIQLMNSKYFIYRAGTDHANAIYGQIGNDATGRPSYYSQTSMVSLCYNGAEERWEITDDDTTQILYANYSRSRIPPSVGWQIVDGSTPIPTVRFQSGEAESDIRNKARSANRARSARIRRVKADRPA